MSHSLTGSMDLHEAIKHHFSASAIGHERHLNAALQQLVTTPAYKDCTDESLVTTLLHFGGVFSAFVFASKTIVSDRARELLIRPWCSLDRPPQPQCDAFLSLKMFVENLPIHFDRPKRIVATYGSADAAWEALCMVARLISRGRTAPKGAKGFKGVASGSPEERLLMNQGLESPECLKDARQLVEALANRIQQTTLSYLNFVQSDQIANYARKELFGSLRQNGLVEVQRSSSDGFISSLRIESTTALAFLRDGAEAGKWPIIYAQQALGRLRQLAIKDRVYFNVIQRKIGELADGRFSPSNHGRFLHNEFSIPLFEAHLQGNDGESLIYQIDCGGPAADPEYESQVIRIFDISRSDDPFWRKLAKELDKSNKEYQSRCNERSVCIRGVEIVQPVVRRRTKGSVVTANPSQNDDSLADDDILKVHRTLALEKFIPHSRELWEAVRTGTGGTFMFSMSGPERDIIHHDSSCIVFGRSGTGKTTTILFKILTYELASFSTDGPSVRQIFVTQSPALASKVQEYYDELKKSSLDFGTDGYGSTSPLTHTLKSVTRGDREEKGCLLPKKFSELRDDNFPLFLSFQELCELVANDFDLQFDPDPPSLHSFRSILSAQQPGIRCGQITYAYFISHIWPQLKATAFDPILVFNEFIGVIKGIEQTLDTETGYLSRTGYETLSTRMYPVFARERSQVYDLFERYTRIRPKLSWDAADRCHCILRAISSKPNGLGLHTDFLYVDEVQDNLLIETALMRTLCRNPHGLFLAGDTAQTISAGSSFRFNDLKAFLYTLERVDPVVMQKKRKPVDPELFDLSVNYRSHGGIIQMAAFLVKLLGSFFPNSIDKLAEEKARVSGPRPIFYLDRKGQTPFDHFVSDSHTKRLAFGSNQVIIVRDELARDRLIKKVGKYAGMIKTLYASKGQEFNDVLLFDFFADSTASEKDWEVLKKYAGSAGLSGDFPEVDLSEIGHTVLRTELKCLYVGLTRARNRVWLWDATSKGSAFQELIVNSGLAVSKAPDEPVHRLGVKSTPEEWAKRGRTCFQQEDYANASLCFEQASMSWWESVSNAHLAYQATSALPATNGGRVPALRKCAKAFGSCAEDASTREDYKMLIISAARCYVEAKDYTAAAEKYRKAEKFSQAAWCYRLADRFDEALAIIHSRPDEVDADLADKITELAKLVYARKREFEKARALFASPRPYVQWLEDNGFEDQAVNVLQDMGLFEEAAKIFLRRGNYLPAAESLLRVKTQSTTRRAVDCLLHILRFHLSYGSAHTNSDQNSIVATSLSLLSQVSHDRDTTTEIQAYRMISEANIDQLVRFGNELPPVHAPLALLCFDRWYQFIKEAPLGSRPSSLQAVVNVLELYNHYGQIVREMGSIRDFREHSQFQNVFGLVPLSHWSIKSRTKISLSSTKELVVLPHSPIYHAAAQDASRGSARIPSSNGVLLSGPRATYLIHSKLQADYNALLGPLIAFIDKVKSDAPFEICTRFVTLGQCTGVGGPRVCNRLHPSARELNVQYFNDRIRLHLLVISILDHVVVGHDERRDHPARRYWQRQWLERFFETCFPWNSRLGTVSDISRDLIPKFDQLIRPAKVWIQEVLSDKRPGQSPFLTDTLIASTLATTFDYENAKRYLSVLPGALGTHADPLHPRTLEALTFGLNWLTRNETDCLLQGFLFIEQVVKYKWSIDVNFLAAFIEDLCAHTIVNHRRHSGYSEKGLVLPRSWMVRVLQQGTEHTTSAMPIPVVACFIEDLGNLIQALRTGDGGSLQIRGRMLSGVKTRMYPIARLCRGIALLGQNIDDAPIRQCCLTALRELRPLGGDSRPPPRVYASYLARTWEQVSAAMFASFADSPIDEMVNIFDKPVRSLEKLRSRTIIGTLTWTDDADLLRKLYLGPVSASALPPSPPASTTKSTPFNAQVHSNDHEAMSPALRQNEGPRTTHNEQERFAVARIQAAYKRYQERREASASPSFSAFNNVAQHLPVSVGHRTYCLYLRGPLPHVINFLDELRGHIEEAKEANIRKIQTDKQQGLARLERRARRIRVAAEETEEIYGSVEPDSMLHLNASVEDLRERVGKIPKLVAQVEKFVSHKVVNDDYSLGVQTIVDLRSSLPLPVLD